MGSSVTLTELAEQTGQSVATLGHWQDIGLLPDDSGLDQKCIERVRLIEFCDQRGVPPKELARISADQGDLLASFVDTQIAPAAAERYSFDEAAQELGLDPALLDRVRQAAGLQDQRFASKRDLDTLRTFSLGMSTGLPEEALLQIIRV